MNRSRVLLTLFLLLPFLALAAVMWGISRNRPEMNAPPVGAGAGHTGGANAIGEYLAHGSAKPRQEAPVVEAPSAPQASIPKPDTRPIDAARTTYPRGTVTTLSVPAMTGGETRVEIQVFTPPGYEAEATAATRYPVLYLVGDKVFEPQGWGADDTASKVMSDGLVSPAVIVAVPGYPEAARQGKWARSQWDDAARLWMKDVLLPAIEAAYRIRPGASERAIGGSEEEAWFAADSAGPGTFATLYMQSPGLEERLPPTAAGDEWHGARRVYIATDGADGGFGTGAYWRALPASALVITGDMHAPSEYATWRKRFPYALAFMFPTDADSTK